MNINLTWDLFIIVFFTVFSALLINATAVPADGLRSPGFTPHELSSLLSSETPPLVIDVRSPDEYSSEHIPGAVSIPAPTVDRHLDQIKAAGGNAVLYCNDLHFTKFAEQLLMRKGVTGFHHLEGGLNGWRDAGLDLERARLRRVAARTAAVVLRGRSDSSESSAARDAASDCSSSSIPASSSC